MNFTPIGTILSSRLNDLIIYAQFLSDQRGPHPHGGDAGEGVRRHGPKLSEIAVCPGIPGLSYYGVRSDLRGAGAGHLHQRGHQLRHLDVCGVYGAAVLHPVQNREPDKICVLITLIGCAKKRNMKGIGTLG